MSFQAVAVPYDTSANAFYFSSPESFEQQFDNQFNRFGEVVEEFYIELIDGCSATFELNSVVDLIQCNVPDWFEYRDQYIELSKLEQVAFLWLMQDIIPKRAFAFERINEAFNRMQDVCVFDGSIEDYIYDLVNEYYDLSEFALQYFDYKQLAYDMECNSEFVQFGDYIITNPQDI